MSMSRTLIVLVALGLAPSPCLAEGFGIGKPVAEADVAPWDITIFPDGTGLPPGGGTPAQGLKIYNEKCVMCHAEGGKGNASPTASPLIGDAPLTGLNSPKTIRNYYPYSTILFDYIRRAMPYTSPRSLTNDEVYALTAWILSINKLIGENDAMDAKTLPAVKMPNRDGFIVAYPDRI